jgi:4-hydroxy-tetrahydrodipicolinate reductase
VNPGFVMDRLPLALVQCCVSVERVRVERVVDASRRRAPLRAKVGAGLTVEEFRAGILGGRLGHVGLGESCALLARGLGLSGAEIRETMEPVVATAASPRAGVEADRVAGVRQTAVAMVAGRPVVELRLEISMGAPSPGDRIVIDGDPPLDATLAGGIQGDRATVAAVLNALPHVSSARPGLRTVIDLPLFGLL